MVKEVKMAFYPPVAACPNAIMLLSVSERAGRYLTYMRREIAPARDKGMINLETMALELGMSRAPLSSMERGLSFPPSHNGLKRAKTMCGASDEEYRLWLELLFPVLNPENHKKEPPEKLAGKYLRALRERAGWTRETLGEKLGLTAHYLVAKWENGDEPINPAYYKALFRLRPLYEFPAIERPIFAGLLKDQKDIFVDIRTDTSQWRGYNQVLGGILNHFAAQEAALPNRRNSHGKDPANGRERSR